MSLRHAILTSLRERPASGRELARRFDASIGYFWAATHQQIYRSLHELEAAGLVRASEQATTRGRARTYEISSLGAQELREWVREPEDPRMVRDSLLVRLRAVAALDDDGNVLAEELRRHRKIHQAQLCQYLEIRERDFAHTGPHDLKLLILEAGIGLEEHWISWLETCLQRLDHAEA
jgi:DNA-binding PadR family transcriptional regulator